MRLGKRELTEIGPGWFWDYESGGGFYGKHFVNVNTGAVLSVRQGQAVQRGELTLNEALLKIYGASDETEVVGSETSWTVLTFTNLVGAVEYARKSDTTTYIVGYGRTRVPYPNDVGGLGYRALMSRRRDNSFYQREANRNFIYAKALEQFATSPFNKYYVWEKIR